MKIDNIIFSTSERFSVFWNLNSKIWDSFGIKPICLFFGDIKNTDMNQNHGEIIQMPILENIPLIVQITWSKFWWASQQKEKTSLIGDIDLFPLQKKYFLDDINNIPNSSYLHLDCDGITQLSGKKSWIGANSKNTSTLTEHSTNLPGYYHCAKGDVFKSGLNQTGDLEKELYKIVNSGLYKNNRANRASDPIDQQGLWCAEEFFSTKYIRENITNGNIDFVGKSLANGISPDNSSHFLDTGIKSSCKYANGANGDRIDRTMYNQDIGDYVYDKNKLNSGNYIDLHCIRSFSDIEESEKQKRELANSKILKLAGVI